jgi:hypothetical protein
MATAPSDDRRWADSALLLAWKWTEGVETQAQRVLARRHDLENWNFELDLFVIALHMFRQSARLYCRLTLNPWLENVLYDLGVLVPNIDQARHAVMHSDEWYLGRGRTQPPVRAGTTHLPPYTGWGGDEAVLVFQTQPNPGGAFPRDIAIPLQPTLKLMERAKKSMPS